MEFGVFRGDTINAAADYRKAFCEKDPPPVYGFDTFQGLPETWGNHMEQVQHPLFCHNQPHEFAVQKFECASQHGFFSISSSATSCTCMHQACCYP